MRKARVELIGGHIFGGHHTRSAPIASKSVGVSQVLAHFGGVLTRAQRVGQHEHTAFRIAGQRHRQTQISRVEHAFKTLKSIKRVAPATDCGLRQRVAEHCARILVTQLNRFAIALRRRIVAARFQIGFAQQSAIRRVTRFGLDRCFRVSDRFGHFALGQRLLRFGVRHFRARGGCCGRCGERDAQDRSRGEQGHSGPKFRTACAVHGLGIHCVSPGSFKWLGWYCSDFNFGQSRCIRAARRSSSSIPSNIASRAWVTSACALTPCMVAARRNLRCRCVSRRNVKAARLPDLWAVL